MTGPFWDPPGTWVLVLGFWVTGCEMARGWQELGG